MVYVYCPVVHQMFTLCPQNHVMLHLLSVPSKHNTAQTLSPFSTTVQLCIALPRHQLTRTTRTSGQCVGTFRAAKFLTPRSPSPSAVSLITFSPRSSISLSVSLIVQQVTEPNLLQNVCPFNTQSQPAASACVLIMLCRSFGSLLLWATHWEITGTVLLLKVIVYVLSSVSKYGAEKLERVSG